MKQSFRSEVKFVCRFWIASMEVGMDARHDRQVPEPEGKIPSAHMILFRDSILESMELACIDIFALSV